MFSSSSIDWGAEIFFFFVKLLSVEISIYRFHIMLTRRIRRNPRACQTFGIAKRHSTWIKGWQSFGLGGDAL